MSVSGHRQTKGSIAFSEVLPGQKEATSPEAARRILAHSVERTEIITQKLAVQVESHKTQHILGGLDAFEKNDILNATSRYIEGLGSTPSPDSRRVFLIGKNLHWFSDEPSPTLEQAIRSAEKGAANGVATLDANGKVVQRLSYEGAANGVATLDANGKVVQDPASSTTTPTPNAIPKADGSGKLNLGWIPSGVDAGKLQGRDVSSATPNNNDVLTWDATNSVWKPAPPTGGELTMFTGIVAKDYDPPMQLYPGMGYWTSLATYDIGDKGWLMPVRLVLPPSVSTSNGGAAYPAVRYHFHDNYYVQILNTTSNTLTKNYEDHITELMTPSCNGKAVRKIEFGVLVAGPGGDADLGVFQVRAYAFPKGTGSPL